VDPASGQLLPNSALREQLADRSPILRKRLGRVPGGRRTAALLPAPPLPLADGVVGLRALRSLLLQPHTSGAWATRPLTEAPTTSGFGSSHPHPFHTHAEVAAAWGGLVFPMPELAAALLALFEQAVNRPWRRPGTPAKRRRVERAVTQPAPHPPSSHTTVEQQGSSGLLPAVLASGQGEGQGAPKPALALGQLLCRASRLEAARTFSDALVLQVL
ncbi:hypothetical protein HaLaN_28524, partial [Haematococcus lacustris]